MEKSWRTPFILLLAALFSFLPVGGCDDDDSSRHPVGSHPSELAGTWEENGYDRRVILEDNGEFKYRNMAGSIPGDTEGRGTWETSDGGLTLHLASGHFRWLESINDAPNSFTFQYNMVLINTENTLILTFKLPGNPIQPGTQGFYGKKNRPVPVKTTVLPKADRSCDRRQSGLIVHSNS